MPSTGLARPTCIIDSRHPITGQPLHLAGVQPDDRWSGERLEPRILNRMIRELRHKGSGMLIGLLPYPDRRQDAVSGHDPTPLTLIRYADSTPGVRPEPGHFRITRPFQPDQERAAYTGAVRRVQQYLQAGDAYQVNLCQRFRAGYSGDPLAAWLALRQQFMPPHAAWLDLGDRQLLGFSPESFLEIIGRCITTRPIKGTRPRLEDPLQDREMATSLATAPKDRAENLMIVDLMRNDLGQICEPGSVHVPGLFQIESFRNVHHLVSTVSGTLQAGVGLDHILRACFPGGSITGAPKRRAMEIIQELEPAPRDVYCGSLFWLLPDGTLGSNIGIRSFLARNGELSGWAGAGIVVDSDPEGEYEECLHKLKPLMRAMELL